MKNKLYLVQRNNEVDWDEYSSIIICALDLVDLDRRIEEFNWIGNTDEGFSIEEIGIAHDNIQLGKIILSDFNAG